MKVKLQDDPKEEPKEQPEIDPVKDPAIPEKESTEPIQEPAIDPNESLKLELAELKGQISILRDQKKESPADSAEQQALQTKQRVMTDASNLDDDQFQQIYKMGKLQAVHSVSQYELDQEKIKNSAKFAEFEARNELAAKYPSFAKNFDKVKSVIGDLSPEARKDPERLKKALEREFLYVSQNEKPIVSAPTKKDSDMDRRRITNDFERPTIEPKRIERKDEADLIPVEDRELAAHFGLHKESDRKKFSSSYIPMDLGVDLRDGKRVLYSDPKQGIVKVANS